VGKIVSGFLVEMYVALISGGILIAWYDLFCERKGLRKNFVVPIIWYVGICLALKYLAGYIGDFYSMDGKVSAYVMIGSKFIAEMILAWLIFVRKYKGSTLKRFLLYLPITFLVPTVKMIILTLANLSSLEVPTNSRYIEAINSFTISLATYLLIIIVSEICKWRKSKKSSMYMVLLGVVLVILFALDYLFRQVVDIGEAGKNVDMYLIIYGLLATTSFCVCALRKKHLDDKEYERQVVKRQEMHKRQLNYYQEVNKSAKKLQKSEHDFKKHLLIIKELAKEGKKEELDRYIGELEQLNSKPAVIIDGKNAIVSGQLTYAKARCDENEIKFEYVLAYHQINILPVDLNVILGNILDNAVEASIKAKDVMKRKIKLSIQESKDMIMIGCQNYYDGIIKWRGEQILTNKNDIRNHGIGISNIKEAAKRYDGDVTIELAENNFSIHVLVQNIL